MSAIQEAKAAVDKLSWYQKQYHQLSIDERITAAARDEKLAMMRREMEQYGSTAYRAFEQAWQYIKDELASVDARRRAAAQRESDSWSFDKLRYYRETARDDISRCANLQEVEKLLRHVVAVGPREQARAYLESGGVVLTRYHGAIGVGSLTAWMEREAANIARPPEFDKLDELEYELVMVAVQLRDWTVSAANLYPDAGIGNLLRWIEIRGKIDTVSGNLSYTLNFLEPSLWPIPSNAG